MAVREHDALESIRGRIDRWLQARSDISAAAVLDVEVPESGRSNDTVRCRARWTDAAGHVVEPKLVVRVQAATDGLYPDTDVTRQAAILEALAEAGAPVPAVRWTEVGPTPDEPSFFVMDHVDGRVPQDVPSPHVAGWTTELDPDQRRRLHETGLNALAQLHAIDPDTLPALARPGHGSALDRHLAWLADWHAWAARGRDLGLLDDALRYLHHERPATETTTVVWGDARPGNILYGDDCSVAAVIDFEAAGFGPPEIDVAWWLMFEEFLTDAQHVAVLDGFLDRDATIHHYEAASGRQLQDLPYYEIMAALSFAIIMLRFADREIDAGRLPPDSRMGSGNPVTQMLARKLGRPVPELAPEFAQVAESSTAVTS
jgi:aminoglycoside phosphotransferase (APT) family kinase protein